MAAVKTRGLYPGEFPGKLYELLEKSYKGSREDRRFYNLHFERPYGEPSWDYSRVAEIDGKLVAHVGIWPYTSLLPGNVSVRCGGIRDVCTDPDYQKRGLGHVVLSDSVRFMKEQGIVISVLYAGPIPFYRKKGWIPIPKPNHVLPPGRMDQGKKDASNAQDYPFTLVPWNRGDIDSIKRVHEIRCRTNRDLHFVIERDVAYMQRLAESRFFDPPSSEGLYLVKNRDSGEIEGYMFASIPLEEEEGKNIHIVEARTTVADPVLFFKNVLVYLVSKHPGASINIPLSERHAIVKALIQLGGQDQGSIISGTMVNVLDLSAFLESLAASINHRLASATIDGWNGDTIPPGSCIFRITPEVEADGPPGEFIVGIRKTGRSKRMTIEKVEGIDQGSAECPNTAKFSKETMLMMMFSSFMTLEEMLEDELIEITGDALPFLELVFGTFSWDMELRDHF